MSSKNCCHPRLLPACGNWKLCATGSARRDTPGLLLRSGEVAGRKCPSRVVPITLVDGECDIRRVLRSTTTVRGGHRQGVRTRRRTRIRRGTAEALRVPGIDGWSRSQEHCLCFGRTHHAGKDDEDREKPGISRRISKPGEVIQEGPPPQSSHPLAGSVCLNDFTNSNGYCRARHHLRVRSPFPGAGQRHLFFR